MSKWPEDYVEYVLNDVEKYNPVRKVIKAGLIERYAVRHCETDKIHPNPRDEFSMDDVGPNLEIVGNYAADVRFLLAHSMEVFSEPLIVQKMEPDGYMLLNGHHRWFACLRMKVKKVHIQIVNLVSEEDLNRMIAGSDNHMRVVFDLDEVLLTSDEDMQDAIKDNLFSRRIKERLRLGASDLLKKLQEMGYDIWIYSAGYYSEEYITDFFSMYEITVDGIINGFNEKRRTDSEEALRIRKKMEEKYRRALHIDNESVLCTNTVSKEFEQYEIKNSGPEWAESISQIVSMIPD